MIGTLVNACTIIAGSLVGGFFKKIMSDRVNKALFVAMGLAAFGLGINSVVHNMPDSRFPVLFIASLALGGAIGTMLDIDGRVGRLTSALDKSPSQNPEGKSPRLGEGIVTGSLIFCVGTLSILGPVQSALYSDHTFLFTNATLDLVTSMVLASSYGIGMCLAAGILVIWQGSIYGLTLLVGNFITDTMMCELSIVGGFLIAMSGLGILEIKDCKTLNFLPALVIPPLWCLAFA
ncbi:MAG: DUF554 domain-containing protein [Firmicutes bacterium]|nr:DUF554 domain-containing protein [Bacillota bacterium]